MKRQKRTKRVKKVKKNLRWSRKEIQRLTREHAQYMRANVEREQELRKLTLENETMKRGARFVWTTSDGRRMLLKDMEDRHLQNAITWCQRRLVYEFGNSRWLSSTKKWAEGLYRFLEEAESRGLAV